MIREPYVAYPTEASLGAGIQRIPRNGTGEHPPVPVA